MENFKMIVFCVNLDVFSFSINLLCYNLQWDF